MFQESLNTFATLSVSEKVTRDLGIHVPVYVPYTKMNHFD